MNNNMSTHADVSIKIFKNFVRDLFGLKTTEELPESYNPIFQRIENYCRRYPNFDFKVRLEYELKKRSKNSLGKITTKIQKKFDSKILGELDDEGMEFPDNTKFIKIAIDPAFYDEQKKIYLTIPESKELTSFEIKIGGRRTKDVESKKMMFSMQDAQNFSRVIRFEGFRKEDVVST